MIAALMAYGVIASGLLLLAGLALEMATPAGSIPRRFIWCGAIVLSCGLMVAAGSNLLERDEPTVVSAVSPASVIAPSDQVHTAARSSSIPESIRTGVNDALRWPIATAARLGVDGGVLLTFWGIASASLLAVGMGTASRNRRLRRRWNLVEIEGLRVRVSPATGPAVLGTLRPEIVVPGWLLSSSSEERRLALLHESEHLRARDGLLLAGGWVIVALLPWNVALWWMVLRLRLAIEIDCDRRVLAAGAERKSYGSMLIDVSGHPSGFSFTAPALAGFPSTLERRLVAITTHRSGYSWTRGGFGALLAGLAFLAACNAELPTAADIEAMDAAAVAERAAQLGIDSTSYYIDGERATAEQAGALAPGTIGRVEVLRESRIGDAEAGSIRIYTRDLGEPAYVIDGVPGTAEEFNRLTEEDIGSISILKDASTEVRGFRASNGTVLVTTRAGAAGATSPALAPVSEGPGAGVPGGDAVSVVAQSESIDRDAGPVIGPSAEGGYDLSFGVQVDGQTGEKTPSPIRLRNMGDPLYVIDGIVSGPEAFSGLEPGDIESISVLKGEGGSTFSSDPRARNGVILVVTKAGEQ